jgi:hypothetical protein
MKTTQHTLTAKVCTLHARIRPGLVLSTEWKVGDRNEALTPDENGRDGTTTDAWRPEQPYSRSGGYSVYPSCLSFMLQWAQDLERWWLVQP